MVISKELSPKQLRVEADPKSLGIKHAKDLKSMRSIVGQKRAISALRFGLEIQGAGFNIYVAGPPGIGKMTAVKSFLEVIARGKEPPPDWCYVNNFEDSYRPKALKLTAGYGQKFQKDMKKLVADIRQELPKVFEGEQYATRREKTVASTNKQRDEVLKKLTEKASQAEFIIQGTPLGLAIVPTRNGKPLSEEQIQSLSEKERVEVEHHAKDLQKELKHVMKKIRKIERAVREKLEDLDKQIALHIVGGTIEDLIEEYQDSPEITEYLLAVKKDIIENIETFKRGASANKEVGLQSLPTQPPWMQELPFKKYQVNVIVDNSKQRGAPVVAELNPTYNNLLGRVEKEAQFGALQTDFTMIKAGSLHRANGGFLVASIEDVLQNLLSWDGLKRTLRSGEIQIEELGERLGFLAAKSLRPQPVPIDVKVVLVGRSLWYFLLHAYDKDFPELFKVKADFDIRMQRTKKNIKDFLEFVCTFCTKEKLRHLDSSGVAKLLEYASRLAEDQEKLSTHFGLLVDIIREADFWALKKKARYISAAHVKKAIEEKVYRSNLIEEHIKEMIERGMLLIDTTGEKLRQVNGLSVMSLGDYLFGRPTRITASIHPGREGIIDIEREVELGGPIHSKGVLILSGYLAEKYAQDKPLAFAGRIVFEQSYGEVEGDSASSTELYAILSALSGLPIKQGIAVTGSVNQHGEVQAIGGVNHKIEGFFDVCKMKKITGDQGVIIPQSNIKNLMLREDVVEMVKSKKFHIWAVKTIDEGIEILTGVPAGKRKANGRFPKGTVNYYANQRLQEFAHRLRDFRKGATKKVVSGRKATKKS